jgi:hypothetical protein
MPERTTFLLADRIAGSKHVEGVAKSIIAGNAQSCAISVSGLLAEVASGVPLVGILAREAVQHAFAVPATERLISEYAAYEKEKEREAFIADLAATVESLIAQAVLQLVRVQHNVKDEVFAELGGLRRDLEDFREEFAAEIPNAESLVLGEAVRIELQEVQEGGIGVRVSEGSKHRAFIAKQSVRGSGSVGIVI